MEKSLALPPEVPVMPLPGALLFPQALLPLYIFEPRYREMLDHALHQHRMFCVALLRPGRSEWSSPRDFFSVASVGLIRACVGRADGTSSLILQGLQRVRFLDFEQESPFPIARLERLQSTTTSPLKVDACAEQLLEIYRELKAAGRQFPEHVDRYISELADPEMLADLMTSTFITDPLRAQTVLEELVLEKRLRLVIQYLHEETGLGLA